MAGREGEEKGGKEGVGEFRGEGDKREKADKEDGEKLIKRASIKRNSEEGVWKEADGEGESSLEIIAPEF